MGIDDLPGDRQAEADAAGRGFALLFDLDELVEDGRLGLDGDPGAGIGHRDQQFLGAGGGGFLLFYCENGFKKGLIQSMEKMGLRWEKFHFDFDGTKIVANTSMRCR